MKILYIGCVKSSEAFLKTILDYTDAEIVGIVTKVESSYNADHVSLHTIAEQRQIDWLDYTNQEMLKVFILNKKPEVIYCFGWSYLLPSEIYSVPIKGAIGYHPTMLPENRGRHPIIWTIALGLKQTASTFFYIVDVPDAGNIVSQQVVEISDKDDANTLYTKLILAGQEQIIELTKKLSDGSIHSYQQIESRATSWRKRTKKDGKIDWRMSAENIDRLVRALTKPYVGAHFEYEDVDIKVWKTQVNLVNCSNMEPGKIVAVVDSSFTIKTGDYLLQVLEYEGDFIPTVGQYL